MLTIHEDTHITGLGTKRLEALAELERAARTGGGRDALLSCAVVGRVGVEPHHVFVVLSDIIRQMFGSEEAEYCLPSCCRSLIGNDVTLSILNA